MRFDGSVSENVLGDFCLKMVDSNAISGQIFLILMLDRLSQCRRCALNSRIQCNPELSSPKIFRSYSCFKMNRLQNFQLILLQRAKPSKEKFMETRFEFF